MKKLFSSVLLSFAAFVLLAASYAEGNVQMQSLSIGKLTLDVPQGWSVERDEPSGQIWIYENGDAYSGVYIHCASIVAEGSAGYESEFINAYHEGFFDGDTFRQIKGHTKLTFDMPDNTFSIDRGRMFIGESEWLSYHCVWVQNDMLYAVTYTDYGNSWGGMRADFQRLLSSIKSANTANPNSRKNPAQIGDRIELQTEQNGYTATVAITVEDYYRGDKYDALIADSYAPDAADGYEYVAVRVKVEFVRIDSIDPAVAKTDDPQLYVDAITNFTTYSANGMDYDNVHYSVTGQKN